MRASSSTFVIIAWNPTSAVQQIPHLYTTLSVTAEQLREPNISTTHNNGSPYKPITFGTRDCLSTHVIYLSRIVVIKYHATIYASE